MLKKKQNMIDMFKGYSDYTEEEYKNIWNNALIVVDSNILLNFYRYSEDTRNKIFKILEKLKSRLWIPYQVGKEFFNNKNKVMVNSYKEYDDLLSSLKQKMQEAKEEINKRKNNQLKCKNEINHILDKSINEIESILEKEKNLKKPKFEKNSIEDHILELFNNSIGEPIIDNEYEEMKKEGLHRFKEQIPPGYKDDDKEENGDYYIFYSFMKKAKEENKDIIFITDDVKEDWFNIVNGEKHGGRNELLNEFYKETGQLLIIYTSDGFAESYNKNLDKDFADEKTISELKSIRNIRERENYINLFDKKFVNRLNYYKDNIQEYEDKDELFNELRLIIRRLDIPSFEREKLFDELRTTRHYFYHNNDFESDKLNNIIDKITNYYNNCTIKNEYSNSFIEKYYSCLDYLKRNKSEPCKIRGYHELRETINFHLKYISDFPSKRNFVLSKRLNRLLTIVMRDMDEHDFSNTKIIIEQLQIIIEQLEGIIDNSEMLLKIK